MMSNEFVEVASNAKGTPREHGICGELRGITGSEER
jgi:hypothetical protein